MREIAVGGPAHRRRSDRVHHALGVRASSSPRAGPALAAHVAPAAGGDPRPPCLERRRAARPVRRRGAVSGRHRRLSPELPRRAATAISATAPAPSTATLEGPVHPIVATQPARRSLAAPGSTGSAISGASAPFATLWGALGELLPRSAAAAAVWPLRHLLRLIALLAPATLMLVAHVEQDGVWLIEGGMHRLAVALAELAARPRRELPLRQRSRARSCRRPRARRRRAARHRRASSPPSAVVVNADVGGARRAGRFGPQPSPRRRAGARVAARSLSAVTWSLLAATDGFPLHPPQRVLLRRLRRRVRRASFARALPEAPTVYVCAQDRADRRPLAPTGRSGCSCLVNAPPTATRRAFRTKRRSSDARSEPFAARALRPDGAIDPRGDVVTTPADFERLYPATGGALYGRASHGWTGVLHQAGRADAAFRASISREAASIRARACRWRPCRGGWRRRSVLVGPRFDAPVPPDGYVWWYIDALSDDGRARPHAHRLHRQRVLALLRLGSPRRPDGRADPLQSAR